MSHNAYLDVHPFSPQLLDKLSQVLVTRNTGEGCSKFGPFGYWAWVGMITATVIFCIVFPQFSQTHTNLYQDSVCTHKQLNLASRKTGGRYKYLVLIEYFSR